MERLSEVWKEQSGWKAFVNKATRRHVLQEKLASKIKEAGLKKGTTRIDLTGDQECHCGKVFATKAQLGAHKHKVHGEHSETFWMAQGTSCYVCLKEFWKHSRLQQHLDYVPRNGRPNRCRTFCSLYPDDATFELENEDKAPPVEGLGRNEAIRMQGPLMLGARAEDDEWAWIWRTTCEKHLADKWLLPEPDVLRDSELQNQFELYYSKDTSGDLGSFLEFLNGCDVKSDKLVVNLLFWGWCKKWKTEEEKQSWIDIIHCCPEGPACLEWFEACLSTATCDAVTNAAPHRKPNDAPANDSERLERDSTIVRSIVDCLDTCEFPVFFSGRFWTKGQVEALGHFQIPTGQYCELLQGYG